MKLLEQVQTVRLLDPDATGYLAITRNDHGAVTATGATIQDAVTNLAAHVRALRTPPTMFSKTDGPRDRHEWDACYGEWFA